MRVVHVTDLHVQLPPRVGQLFSKRAVGAVNLYLLGRAGHFDIRTVEALVPAIVGLRPDVVVCTGDLTATATPEEFARAVELLAPVTADFPFLVVPGNHDVYTDESAGRFAQYFGAKDARYPWVARYGGVDFVGVDVARPDWLSRGFAPAGELQALDLALAEGDAPAFVLLHYPLRNRRGEPYGPFTRALENAAAVEGVLVKHPRVAAVLHGHEHHGYRTEIPRPGAPIPSIDPGAGGYAHLPDRGRTAHFCVYEVEATGRFTVERYAWDGARFAPEAGGAFASGG